MDEDTDTIKQDMWSYFLSAQLGVIEGVANGMPWSGNERNHLYFGGIPGVQFEDYSGITGIDDPGDGRAFSLLDYDRDGRVDIALASPGKPRFRLLRNGIGERVGADNGYIALRLVGGNHTPEPSASWSVRDAYGTAVHLDLEQTTVFREHQPESGFVGQHSSTMIIGIGQRDAAKRMEVRWLSGKLQSFDDVPARMLVTVYENPAQSPTGEAMVVEPYERDVGSLAHLIDSDDYWKNRFLPTPPLASSLSINRDGKPLGSEQGLTLIAAMATWCVACVEEMPEFYALRSALSEADLAIVAVPVDAEDTTEMLDAWSAKHQPPYEIVTGVASSEVDRVNAVTLAELRAEAVPATFVTNRDGDVLIARWGVPTVSDIRRLLWQDRAKRREAASAIVAESQPPGNEEALRSASR